MSVRIVTADVDVAWGDAAYGNTEHLARGTMLDVQPGSAPEAAIGTGNLDTPTDPAAAVVTAGTSN